MGWRHIFSKKTLANLCFKRVLIEVLHANFWGKNRYLIFYKCLLESKSIDSDLFQVNQWIFVKKVDASIPRLHYLKSINFISNYKDFGV